MSKYALYVCPNCAWDWVLYENDPRPRCNNCNDVHEVESYGAFMGEPAPNRVTKGVDVRKQVNG